MKFIYCLVAGMLAFGMLYAQETPSKEQLDSLYIKEVETRQGPHKNLHAEPLYIDLIRDLGARKGEREWNIAGGLTDRSDYDEYVGLVEYEWAPANRLGLEIEVPFTFHSKNSKESSGRPSHRVEGLKTAIQWSFFVHEKSNVSMAMGYLNEVVLVDLDNISFSNLFYGNSYNPFYVVAKRWGGNFHTLLYTGPIIEQEFGTSQWHHLYAINSSFHYMITGTRNFVGLEFNKEIEQRNLNLVIRPQMRVEISEHLLIGIVGGVPIKKEKERLSVFLRLIYEPKGKH